MSVRSTLERLIRPDTHDEAKRFTDAELKVAAEKAVRELEGRGWAVRKMHASGGLDVRRRASL